MCSSDLTENIDEGGRRGEIDINARSGHDQIVGLGVHKIKQQIGRASCRERVCR